MSKKVLKMENPTYQLHGLGNNPLHGLSARMTDEQYNYADSMIVNDITFSNSPSGTGKTTLAVGVAKLLWEYRICPNGLVYLFAPVQEHSMGHRPGTQEEKNDAYLDPLYDALVECGDQLDKGLPKWVEAKPHTFLRGTNLEGKFIIIDEAQNMTKPELKKILTRIHSTPNTRTAVLGHVGQIDLKNKMDSGFASCIEHFRGMEKCGIHTLTQRNFRGWVSEHADKW